MNNKKNNLLLISIKPQYAKKIFEGEKTIELRKSAPQRVDIDDYMLIYVTSPVKELWGVCKIQSIVKNEPEIIWNKYGNVAGISKEDFDDYYKETTNGYGIELKEVKALINTISLEELRVMIPDFTAPQTYRYIDEELINNDNLKKLLT
ncbi:ASCH domain-containing protein [Flavobacterium sp. HBTb2-11-1]|uniref:ASCH domain-containing protein n=1 Tax=Flavobacterium sp. HBTb2-11-1 TaxID=2692212 RepID=UPI00136B2BE7|nr:ASCH domain-containing protein [Flavobacterium sp. HBTb2-11-1]MXO04009.1 ASCH domain-containing protein [Flavobacterium sp. HBTb2-11-1]